MKNKMFGIMKLIIAAALFVICAHSVAGQTKYIDRRGKAIFFSSAPLEDIRAENNQAVSIIDAESGDVVASMLMRSFNFRKSLMEEHFNENYVESDKYPKATFKGRITNVGEIDFSRDGKYVLEITGDLTLHGVTRPLTISAEAQVSQGAIQAKAVFPLKVKDFDIKVPRLVINNIAEEVEVTVTFNYQQMNP